MLKSYEDCGRIDLAALQSLLSTSPSVFRTEARVNTYVPASLNTWINPSFQNRKNVWIRINVCIRCSTRDGTR